VVVKGKNAIGQKLIAITGFLKTMMIHAVATKDLRLCHPPVCCL